MYTAPIEFTYPATLPCLASPHISLLGEVNIDMARQLAEGLKKPPETGAIAIELSTQGGDADLARRMVLDIETAREDLAPRRLVFFGKSYVYSAGVTLMSAFPKQDRYLSSDAVLLIHSRQLDKDLRLSGPIRASLPKLRALCHEIELGIRLEEDGFRRLIEGSEMTLEEILEKAPGNLYLTAREALERGLIAGIC